MKQRNEIKKYCKVDCLFQESQKRQQSKKRQGKKIHWVMNPLLRILLRPFVYGSAVVLGVAAAAAATQTRRGQQDQQQQQQQQQSQLMQSAAASASKHRVTTAAAAAAFTADPPARNAREERFLGFASVEHDGVPYMTPEDFLESVTQDRPRYRQRRKSLSKHKLDRILHKTPSRKCASTKLLRELGHEGIISYPEYLFLLSTLANPKSGFAIAFNMIDRSRNQSVEKAEFVTLNAMVSEWQEGAQLQDTTLMRHLFGRSGKDCLNYAEFAKFMANLQHEVLEIEFLEFSKGLPTIAESDFARVLLRYTNLSAGAQAQYIEKIKEKLVREEGIDFQDFRLFFQFINSLHDFAMALRMYALAGHAVTQEEFQRAVKACVGYTLAPRVVSIVFLLFDEDEDGSLSAEEFVGIIRDRLRRLSQKPRSAVTPLGEFKKCLKRQIQKDGVN